MAGRVAAVVVVVLGVGAGFATFHGRSEHINSPASKVNPTPSPSTAAERVTAVMNAVNTATSVHVLAQFRYGGTWDIVVTQDGAVGTLTYKGKTYSYLSVGKGPDFAGYFKGDGWDAQGRLTPAQVAATHGRWVANGGGAGPLSNLVMLSQWFYPGQGYTTTLGQTKTINGIATIALIKRNVDPNAAVQPVRLRRDGRPLPAGAHARARR